MSEKKRIQLANSALLEDFSDPEIERLKLERKRLTRFLRRLHEQGRTKEVAAVEGELRVIKAQIDGWCEGLRRQLAGGE